VKCQWPIPDKSGDRVSEPGRSRPELTPEILVGRNLAQEWPDVKSGTGPAEVSGPE